MLFSRLGRTSVLTHCRIGVLMTLALVAAIVSYSTTSASLDKNAGIGQPSAKSADRLIDATTPLRLGTLSSSFMLQAPPPPEGLATYATDNMGQCTNTAQTTFNLGETVCVKTNGVATDGSRSVTWSNTASGEMERTDLAGSPDDTFQLPATQTSVVDGIVVDNRGTWTVKVVLVGRSKVRVAASFTVRDPNNPAFDLNVYSAADTTEGNVPAGTNLTVNTTVSNFGPNDAASVELNQAVPSNATFVSGGQSNVGPPNFTCTNPSSGGVGGSICTIANLPAGSSADFTFVYMINGSAPKGTLIDSLATVTPNTTTAGELHTPDNAWTAKARVTDNPNALTCAVGCPANITVGAASSSGTVVNFAADIESSGDCGTITTTPASGSTFPVGTTTVNVSSSQGSGTCSFTITVTETAAPTITCAANQTAQATGGETETSVNVNAPTADGTNVTITGVRNDNRAVADPYPVGTSTITWTATECLDSPECADSNARTASCTQTITVTSADAPAISCPTNKTFSASGCSFTATAADIGSPTTTGGPAPVTVQGERSDHLGLYADPYPGGLTVITWTATDAVGRITSCNQTINVNSSGGGDTTPPTLSVPPNVTAQASSCTATLDDELGAASGDDTCSAVTITRTGVPTFACPTPSDPNRRCESFVFPTGTTVITYTARDASGNTTTGTQNVTVTENPAIPPTITAPADSAAFADANCQAAIPDYTAGSTAADNCGTVTLSQTPAAGTLVGYGPHTVTVKATDPSGNFATDDVIFTVNDNTPPTVTAPPDASDNANGSCQASVPDFTAGTTAADNCGTVTLSQSPAAGTLVGFGPHTVTVTANDGHGNTNSDDVVFTVNDVTPPTITAPADSAAFADANCQAAVPDYRTSTVAADNCGNVTLSQSPAPGTLVGYGPHTVTVTASDGHGNATSDDVVFTVNDNTPPVISCPANVTVYLPLNSTATSMVVTYPNATATDNCGQPITIAYTKASGTVFNVGPTSVTATATDSHGNTASCTFIVKVLYNFTGFFSPVDNLPIINQMNAGRAVPTKFSLSGNKGLNIFAAGSPNSVQVTCSTGVPVSDVEETVTAGNSTLSYEAGSDRYNYVWKTENSWANTCRQLNVVLNDGTTHSALFRFR